MSISSESVARTELGAFGEAFAADYLQRCLGWMMVDRNVWTRFGEIDLVMRAPHSYVFVEVRTRASETYGSPMESVTPWKITKLVSQIINYQNRHKLQGNVRLDVVGLLVRANVVQSIRHETIYS